MNKLGAPAFSISVAARAALVGAQHSKQAEACRQRVTPRVLKRQCNLSGRKPHQGRQIAWATHPGEGGEDVL